MRHYGSLSTNSKKAPAGFKWCPRCGETKKLDEFNSVTKSRAGRKVSVPDQMCRACRPAHNAHYKARQKAAE